MSSPARRRPQLNRRHFIALGALATIGGVIAIVKGRFVTNTQARPPKPPPKPPPVAPPTLFPPLLGLVQRDGRRPAAFASQVSSIVIQAPLSSLWPSPGTAAITFAPLDALIARAKADGISAARLRVTTARFAPAWLTAQVGSYVDTDPTGKTSLTFQCPIWWSPAYLAMHEQFDAALAARYDGDPFIREVSIWAVGTSYSAEPAIRNFADAATLAAALKAGYTTALDLAACYGFVDSMASHWKQTRLHGWLPMGWQVVTAGHVKRDLTVTAAYANHIIAANPYADLGVDNADQVAYAQDPTYAMRKALTSLKTHGDQTATWVKLGSSGANLLTTLRNAAADGVSSMELPHGYETGVSPAQMAPFDAALRANSQG